MKVVFVDNFDSFTFNLVDEFARRGCDVEVWRNTARAEHVLDRATSGTGPRLLVLSPGPGRPEAAGCCIELIRLAAGRVPVLGVCLGHQVMLEAFGVAVEQAEAILHGRSSTVRHEGDRLFDGIPSPLMVIDRNYKIQLANRAVWEYTGENNEPVLHKEPLEFEYVKPSQRSYK